MNAMAKRWGWALGMAVALMAGSIGGARAATQFWMLQNVTLADGGTVTGSFGFDDVTDTLTDWNIRVQGGSGYLPFTFVPGNSTPVAGGIAIGPVLLGAAKPVHILTPSATVRRIVNMTALTVAGANAAR